MNRILLTAVSLMILGTFAFGQSFTITDANSVDVTGDTVYVNADKDSTEIIAEFHVTNNSSSTLTVKAKKTELSLTTGTTNTFCWVLCYSPTTYVSSQSLSMAAGHTTAASENLSGHFFPAGNAGYNMIAYTVYDMNNTSDSAIVYVVYDITTGINKSIDVASFSLPYPNPADQFINLKYNAINGSDVEFTLHNIVGKEILNRRISTNENLFTLNTADLREGVYFYSITENKKLIKTGKITITH